MCYKVLHFPIQNHIIAGISRRNQRFKSSSLTTTLVAVLFEISKFRFLSLFSDYVLMAIAKVKSNDSFTFAVGLHFYTNNQHQKANHLFVSIHDFANLTPRALYLVSMCASWQLNLNILKRIESEIDYDSIKLFVGGLILHNSSPEDSVNSFERVHGSYLKENPEGTEKLGLPEYVRNSMNVSKPIPLKPYCGIPNGLMMQLEPKNFEFMVLPSGVSDLILISYTSSYLFALSDTVIGRIRKSHDKSIILIITISRTEDASLVIAFCQKLSLKYGKVFWKVVTSRFDLPILSSVIRLVFAQELFEVHYVRSILMLDGDTSFIKVDPVQVWENGRSDFDIALMQNQSLCPWERMSLGFTILNDTKFTRDFLIMFDSYVTAHILEDRAFWTLDQTAAFLVLQAMMQNSQNQATSGIKIFDLSLSVDLGDFIFTDKSLARLKLRAKGSNRDFVSGMSEALYLP